MQQTHQWQRRRDFGSVNLVKHVRQCKVGVSQQGGDLVAAARVLFAGRVDGRWGNDLQRFGRGCGVGVMVAGGAWMARAPLPQTECNERFSCQPVQ
jgi:hypothetical protein